MKPENGCSLKGENECDPENPELRVFAMLWEQETSTKAVREKGRIEENTENYIRCKYVLV